MRRKKQNFMEGAVSLLLAGLCVKLIGAFFRVPLKNLIGGQGMGLFTVAYRLYSAMLVIATVGLPVALSKMIAEAATLGREREVRRIMHVAAGIFIPLGVAGSMALYFGAAQLAESFGSVQAQYAVMAVAPSVALVAVISVLRGYYQGLSDMRPTAVSQLLEAIGKLVIGLGLAVWALWRGQTVEIVAANAILGVTVGEVFAAGYLIFRALLDRMRVSMPVYNDAVRSVRTLAITLLSLSVPIMITSLVMSVTDLIDLALVMNRLCDIGVTQQAATAIYGIYSAMPVTLFNLPQTIISALAVSIIPAVSGALAQQNFQKISQTIGAAIRIGLLITLPAGTGLCVLAQPILRLLFREDTESAAPMLQILSFAVPCVAIVVLTNSVLQALGRIDLPLMSMFAGAMVKLLGDFFFIGNPQLKILGAPLSTVLCYGVIALINLVQVYRLTHGLPKMGQALLRPLAASLGMGAAANITYTLLAQYIRPNCAVLLAMIAACVVYGVLLLALRAVLQEDLLLLPGGKGLLRLMELQEKQRKSYDGFQTKRNL